MSSGDDTAPKMDDEEVQDILDALDEADAAEAANEVEASEHSKRVMKAASVVPIHDAPVRRQQATKRGPGRPRKIAPKPTRDDLIYHQKVMAEQTQFIDGDELVKAARGKVGPAETLQLLKERIAMRAAELEFQRIEMQKRGAHKDAPQVISRQIAALKEIANIEAEIQKTAIGVFNLRDERFQKVFTLLIETFRDVAKEMLSPEQFDLVWNRLETSLEGWEDKAEDLVR